MSSVAPASSASNTLPSTFDRGLTLVSPDQLSLGLLEYTPAERYSLICKYYEACVGMISRESRPSSSYASSEVESGRSVVSLVKGGEVLHIPSVGRCYLRANKREKRVVAMQVFGVEPTYAQLMGASMDLFLPVGVLKKIRVRCGTRGVDHVGDDGEYDLSQVICVLGKSRSWPAGSLASAVLAADRRQLPPITSPLSLENRLGGEASEICHKRLLGLADLFAVGHRSQFEQIYGLTPTVRDILGCPVSWFKPRREVLSLQLDRSDPEVMPVCTGGDVFWLQYATAAAKSGSYPSGSLGASLGATAGSLRLIPESADVRVQFAGKSKVGLVPEDFSGYKGEFDWAPAVLSRTGVARASAMRYIVCFSSEASAEVGQCTRVGNDQLWYHGAFDRSKLVVFPPCTELAGYKPVSKHTVVRLCQGTNLRVQLPPGGEAFEVEEPLASHCGSLRENRFVSRMRGTYLEHINAPSIESEVMPTPRDVRENVDTGVQVDTYRLKVKGDHDYRLPLHGRVVVARFRRKYGSGLVRFGSIINEPSHEYGEWRGLYAGDSVDNNTSLKISSTATWIVDVQVAYVVDSYAFDGGGLSPGRSDFSGYSQL